MNLKESNRWVKKAQTIPWPEIEKRYAALFPNRKGNVAKPLRLALGACIIQAEYGFADEETAFMIQENPYLQYFCGYPGYDDETLPFAPSLMVYFRKRLTPEVLGEINEMIVRDAADKIYRNRENLNDCKEHGIRLSGPALGRPRKGETRDKAQDYRAECERVEVERRFSLAKRKCGMGLVTAKLRETAAHVIAMAGLVLNLRKIQCAILQLLAFLRTILSPKQKWAFVQ